MTLLTDDLKAFIGAKATYVAPEEIGRAAIRYFAVAIGDNNPLYSDDDFAKSHGYPSVIAPPTYICESNQYVTPPPDARGYIGHLWELPVEGCRLIRGGHSYEFFERPALPTDRLAVTWEITDMVEKASSDGSEMLLVTSIASYADQEGLTLATNTETLIYKKES